MANGESNGAAQRRGRRVHTDDAVKRVDGEAERAECAQALALDVHVGEEAPVEHQEREHVLVGRVHVEQVERRGHVPEERVQRVRQHQALLPGLAASTDSIQYNTIK